MKKLFYAALVFGGLFFVKPADAQVNVSLNIGVQPSWGPVGYDYARYYYMPEFDMYYDVSNRYYTYYDGRTWVSHRTIPRRYRGRDFHRTYKVVINESRPWRNHRHYQDRYHGYSRNYSQVTIRDGGRHHHRADKRYRKMEKEHYKYHKKMDKRWKKGRHYDD